MSKQLYMYAFCILDFLFCYLENVKVLIGCFPVFLSFNLASRFFFKQPTSWRPRSSKDIMISIASQMSGKPHGTYEKTYRLPVQVNICLTRVMLELHYCYF
jgi:hypothetical protein